MPLLLLLHIIACSLGYFLFGLTSVIAFIYLRQERAVKTKRWQIHKPFRLSLHHLDRCLFAAIAVGFVATGLGLSLGIVLQVVKYGTAELASPRVLFPTVIWVSYLVLLAFRLVTGLRGKIPSYMAVYGFPAVAMSFVFELFLAEA